MNAICNLFFRRANNLCVGEHVGTHMDSMIHSKPSGSWDLSEIPLERLTGPAAVFDIKDKLAAVNDNYALTVQDILDYEEEYGVIPSGAIIVLCSGWSDKVKSLQEYWGNRAGDLMVPNDPNHWPAYGLEAAKFLAENRSVVGLATDTGSCDVGNAAHPDVHLYILPRDIWCIEGMANTCNIPKRGATIYAFPLKVRGGTGAPTRVVASWDEDILAAGSTALASCITLVIISIVALLI